MTGYRFISDVPPEPGTEGLHRMAPAGEPSLDEYRRAPAHLAGVTAGAALGVDLYARYQRVDNALAMAQAGVRLAFVKATDGGARAYAPADPIIQRCRAVAGPLAFQLGLYHYAQPTPGPEIQAGVLAAEVRRLGAADLWPVLDLEGTFQTMPVGAATDFARRFLSRISAEFGAAVLYANTYLLGRLVVDGWGLPWLRVWAANYGANDGTRHALPARWVGAAAHQFTDRGVVPGVSGYVDLDYTRDLGLITQGEEATLATLTDQEQHELLDRVRWLNARVAGMLRQQWYVMRDGVAVPVGEGTEGAIPAAALDTLDGNTLMRRMADLSGQLTSTEVAIVAATRQIVADDPDGVITAEQLDQLAGALRASLPPSVTSDQIVSSMRRVFAEHGVDAGG